MLFSKKKKILVVDDDDDIRFTVTVILEDMGFSVFEEKDGPHAVKAAVSKKPDLIILDVSLPGMDGFRVCHLLKNKTSTKNIPVILLTGKGAVADVTLGFQAGADEYLIKPLEWERLKVKISKLLDIEL